MRHCQCSFVFGGVRSVRKKAAAVSRETLSIIMRKSVYLPNQGGYNPEPNQGRYTPKNPSSSYTSSRPKGQPSAYYDRSSPQENREVPRAGTETLMVLEREFGQHDVLETFGKRGPHLGGEPDAMYWDRTGPPPSPPSDEPQRHCVCRCPMCPVHGRRTMGQTTKHNHGPQKKKYTKGAPEDVDSSSVSTEDE